MKCAWQDLIRILLPWLGTAVDSHKDTLQEIRLRLGQPTELILHKGSVWLQREASAEDLNFCVNTASRYSPWAAQTVAQGFITAPGGHRIGICGDAVIQSEVMTGNRSCGSEFKRLRIDFGPSWQRKNNPFTGLDPKNCGNRNSISGGRARGTVSCWFSERKADGRSDRLSESDRHRNYVENHGA